MHLREEDLEVVQSAVAPLCPPEGGHQRAGRRIEHGCQFDDVPQPLEGDPDLVDVVAALDRVFTTGLGHAPGGPQDPAGQYAPAGGGIGVAFDAAGQASEVRGEGVEVDAAERRAPIPIGPGDTSREPPQHGRGLGRTPVVAGSRRGQVLAGHRQFTAPAERSDQQSEAAREAPRVPEIAAGGQGDDRAQTSGGDANTPLRLDVAVERARPRAAQTHLLATQDLGQSGRNRRGSMRRHRAHTRTATGFATPMARDSPDQADAHASSGLVDRGTHEARQDMGGPGRQPVVRTAGVMGLTLSKLPPGQRRRAGAAERAVAGLTGRALHGIYTSETGAKSGPMTIEVYDCPRHPAS